MLLMMMMIMVMMMIVIVIVAKQMRDISGNECQTEQS